VGLIVARAVAWTLFLIGFLKLLGLSLGLDIDSSIVSMMIPTIIVLQISNVRRPERPSSAMEE
jgi:hypothetical protein